MKYEEIYHTCFDAIIMGYLGRGDSIRELLNAEGIEIIDDDKFKEMLLSVFDKMHEENIMKPKENINE